MARGRGDDRADEAPAVRRSRDWPLVGREAELTAAQEVLADRSRSVVLSGVAGVGKSRLAAQVAETAAAPDGLLLRAVGSESAATIPFGALAALLPRLGAERDPLALLQLVRADLARRADGGPVVLWVDDAHLLDAGSATLVQQLVTAGSAQVVATVRTAPASVGAGSEPADAVVALSRGGDATVIEVGPLDLDGVQRLLEAGLGGEVARSAAKQLWERSGGNPLYLRELVDAALLDGGLDSSSGVWTLRGRRRRTTALDEMLRTRLGRLAAADRDAVELLALADVLSLSMLERLCPGADVEALEERGVVVVDVAGQRVEVTLGHPLYAETVRAAIPVTRRRRHHEALADAVAGCGARRREDVLRTAGWALDADRPVAPELLATAADQAAQRFDLGLATRLAEAALAAGVGAPARVTLAEIAFRDGRPQDALAVLTQAAAETEGDEQAVAVADAHAHVLSVLGRSDEAFMVLEDVRTRLGRDARDRIDARAIVLMLFAGRPQDALAGVDRLVGSYGGRDPMPGRLRLRADYVAAIALALLGREDEALAVAAGGAAYLGANPRPGVPPEEMLIGSALARLGAGRLQEAHDDAARLEAAMLELGDRDGEATGALLLGRTALAAGDLAVALGHFRRAAAGYRDLGDRTGLRWSLAGVALAHGLRGQADDAVQAVDELQAADADPVGLFEPDLVVRGLAWADVAAGRYDAARSRLAAAAELADGLGQPVAALVVRVDSVRLGDRPALDPLADLAASLATPYAAAAGAYAAALRSGRGDDLLASAERWESVGALVEAAETALVAAAAYQDEGLPRRVTAARARAAALVTRCPGVRTPALALPAAATVDLTAREREIAELAVRRLSAAEIAERLVLSRRTVENHLQRIYAKLGVTGRAELADRLRSDPTG